MFQDPNRQETVIEQLYMAKAKFLSMQGMVNATHPDPFVSNALNVLGDILNMHIVAAKMMGVVVASAEIFLPQGILPGIDDDYDKLDDDLVGDDDYDEVPF